MQIEITDESLEDIVEQWLDRVLEDLRADKRDALIPFCELLEEVVVAFLKNDIRVMQSMGELDSDGVDEETVAAAKKLIARYTSGGSHGSETT